VTQEKSLALSYARILKVRERNPDDSYLGHFEQQLNRNLGSCGGVTWDEGFQRWAKVEIGSHDRRECDSAAIGKRLAGASTSEDAATTGALGRTRGGSRRNRTSYFSGYISTGDIAAMTRQTRAVVFIAGQKRDVFGAIKPELRRRFAIESRDCGFRQFPIRSARAIVQASFP
jgi:hypothetical protein